MAGRLSASVQLQNGGGFVRGCLVECRCGQSVVCPWNGDGPSVIADDVQSDIVWCCAGAGDQNPVLRGVIRSQAVVQTDGCAATGIDNIATNLQYGRDNAGKDVRSAAVSRESCGHR